MVFLAWDSFFHLHPDDQRQMFPIFRTHAAPRAALMFTSGPSHGEAVGSFEGEPLYHASLDSAEHRNLLAQNGFAVVAHAVEDPTCGRHTVWLAQLSSPVGAELNDFGKADHGPRALAANCRATSRGS